MANNVECERHGNEQKDLRMIETGDINTHKLNYETNLYGHLYIEKSANYQC